MNWLNGMHVANVFVSGPIGIPSLVSPTAMRALTGIPDGDPVHFGITAQPFPNVRRGWRGGPLRDDSGHELFLERGREYDYR